MIRANQIQDFLQLEKIRSRQSTIDGILHILTQKVKLAEKRHTEIMVFQSQFHNFWHLKQESLH